MSERFLPDNIHRNGLMTSHIITVRDKFTRLNDTFDPTSHYIEIADGTKMSNVALKHGDAEVVLQDITGLCSKVTLKEVLFIPSYPQSIVSVQAATRSVAKVIFQRGGNKLISKDGTIFPIEQHERLYYLKTVNNHEQCNDSVNDMMSSDKVNLISDVKTWPEILGH